MRPVFFACGLVIAVYRLANSGVGVPMTIHVPFYAAAVSGLLCLTMLAGPASANIKDPLQGCAALLNCANNGANASTTSDPPKTAGPDPSTINSTIAGGFPEHEALPLPLMHPEFFGYINQDPDPAPVVVAAVVAANGDPVPEPASLAILGAALLWLRLTRGRRIKV